MNTKQDCFCIFCGATTEEQHQTGIGMVHIHSECLADLEEILSLTVTEKEVEQMRT